MEWDHWHRYLRDAGHILYVEEAPAARYMLEHSATFDGRVTYSRFNTQEQLIDTLCRQARLDLVDGRVVREVVRYALVNENVQYAAFCAGDAQTPGSRVSARRATKYHIEQRDLAILAFAQLTPDDLVLAAELRQEFSRHGLAEVYRRRADEIRLALSVEALTDVVDQAAKARPTAAKPARARL